MPTKTYYEYAATETALTGPPPVYEVKGNATASGLVDGEMLSLGDQFVYNGKIFTYAGGADTGAGEVGFFATNSGGATKFFSLSPVPAHSVYYLESGQDYTVPVVCFARATRIATPNGEIAVEELKIGDLVTIVVNGKTAERPVKWIGHRFIQLSAHPRPETAQPVRIQRGAFADNVPHRDLLVSPDHAIFVDGKLICARQLINGSTIRQEYGDQSVDYYHIKTDGHAILLAEGLAAESYLDTGNKAFFANTDQPTVLHPDMTSEADFPTREQHSCAPFASDEASVRPIWQRLVDRAAALGQPVPPIDVATDPDLRVIAQGKTLRPVHASNGVYQFMLPSAAANVRVISRAAAPTDARPWLEDRRRLGVYAERIVLRCANDVTEVPVDHPTLSSGWWEVEHNGTEMRRWTNGDAVLQLPVISGSALLEIRASSSGMEYPVQAVG